MAAESTMQEVDDVVGVDGVLVKDLAKARRVVPGLGAVDGWADPVGAVDDVLSLEAGWYVLITEWFLLILVQSLVDRTAVGLGAEVRLVQHLRVVNGPVWRKWCPVWGGVVRLFRVVEVLAVAEFGSLGGAKQRGAAIVRAAAAWRFV